MIILIIIVLLILTVIFQSGGYPGRKVPMAPHVRKLISQGYNTHKMISGKYPNIKVKQIGKYLKLRKKDDTDRV